MSTPLKRDEQIERLVNLTFAFLNLEKFGQSFLTFDWVVKNVPGYDLNTADEKKSLRALNKMFNRDRKQLMAAGVPIETVALGEHVGYRLQADDYRLPEVSFTPEEATVLALAGQMGNGDELATFSRSGWTKIAASGVHRDLSMTPQFTSVNDFTSLPAKTLDEILQATKNHTRISFMYTANVTAEPVERWMDPWGIVSVRDRLYLVGHDLDRDEARCFRITRVAEVVPLDMEDEVVASYGDFNPADPKVNLQDLVEDQLRRGRSIVTAQIHALNPQGCAELVAAGTETEPQVFELVDVDLDWLVRTACACTPHAKVLGPPDVVASVVKHLHVAAGA